MKQAKAVMILTGLLLLMALPAAAQQSVLPTAAGGKAPPAATVSDPANPSDYVGSETCKSCHGNQYHAFGHTKMGRVMLTAPRNELEARGCEACHGPGRSHIEGGGDLEAIIRFGKNSKQSADLQNAQCLQCHEKGIRLFWRGSPHESRGLTCVTCHQVMNSARKGGGQARFLEPLSENREFVRSTQAEVCFQCHQMRRAQLQRSSHMPFREGKVTCSSCHNPHGTPNPKQLIEATTNDNCYKCHAERRGPFLWEHPPVMENCMNCHEAHGSSNPQLLKARTPRLCQQCHDLSDTSAAHQGSPFQPSGKGSHFAFNRSCTNCHTEIHGSNHPSGVRFQR